MAAVTRSRTPLPAPSRRSVTAPGVHGQGGSTLAVWWRDGASGRRHQRASRRWHDFVLVTIISAIPRPVRGIRQPRNGCSARIFHCAQLRTTPHHAVAHEVVNHVPVVMQAHSVDVQHKLQLSQLRGPRRRKQPPKSTAMSPNTSGAVVWGSNAVNNT